MKYRVLKQVFGFNAFRARQEEVVDAILEGKDVLTVMPTGSGKSLCYQLPALLAPGCVVVVSPLIALMKDQVDCARENGIAAACLNSAVEEGERKAALGKLFSGKLDLLYLAPERLAKGFFERIKNVRIAFFAVDEAHCISEWGHDFRPDYLALSDIKRLFPNTPIAAFTASATPKVKKDIIDKLELRDPLTIDASLDRPNLFYSVTRKSSDDAFQEILDIVEKQVGESGIIYRGTRNKVEETAEFLQKNGVKALPYHAGMDTGERARNQEAFNNDDVDVIVATIAFGMGIDKSNIRYVVHAELPKNIESYYQETGRAGRDGETALCVLLYSPKDEGLQKYFIMQIEEQEEKRKRFLQLDAMVRMATSAKCRRKTILQYFGEEYAKHNCGSCDICSGDMEPLNKTRDAQIIMSGIARTREQFPAGHIIDVIRGSKKREVVEPGHDKIKTHGAGKHLSKKDAQRLIDELVAENALEKDHENNERLLLTEKGRDILFGRSPFTVWRKKTDSAAADIPRRPEKDDYDSMLFEELRKLRKKLARERGVPPYVVFSDKVLKELCRRKPTTYKDMIATNGVGNKKYHQYGKFFQKAIKKHVDGGAGTVDF